MTAGKIKFKASKSKEFHNLRKDRQLLGEKMQDNSVCHFRERTFEQASDFQFSKKKTISLKKNIK